MLQKILTETEVYGGWWMIFKDRSSQVFNKYLSNERGEVQVQGRGIVYIYKHQFIRGRLAKHSQQ